MRLLLSLCAVGALVGCFPRAQLPDPPARDAPLAVRQQALLDFTGVPERQVTADGGTGATEYLLLGNGREVRDPRDLVPWVEPGSSTAAFATSFETSQSRASVLGLAAAPFPVVPMVALVVSIAASYQSGGAPRLGDSTAYIAGVGVGTVIGTGLMVTSLILTAVALTEREQAFAAYPRDLAQRLGLAE